MVVFNFSSAIKVNPCRVLTGISLEGVDTVDRVGFSIARGINSRVDGERKWLR